MIDVVILLLESRSFQNKSAVDRFVCITCFFLSLFPYGDYKKYVHWVNKCKLRISLCFFLNSSHDL